MSAVRIIENIIDDKLISTFVETNNFKKATVKNYSSQSIGLSFKLRRREAVLNNSEIDHSLIEIFKNVNNFYNFNLDFNNVEFRICKYDSGDVAHFDWHDDIYYDNPNKINALTLIVGLNDEYDGGQLDIKDELVNFKISKNTGIVFPSNIIHRVRAVTSGSRLVLVGWIRFT